MTQDTQVDVLQDASVHQPSALSDLLGGSTSMDVDVDSVESEQNAYKRVNQMPLDTDPLVWWKYHVQEFPHLTRMDRQYLSIDRGLYTYMTSYLTQVYRLSIIIPLINSWLIRLSVDNVLLINTRILSIFIDKSIPLSIG